jgi:hypothetical protein
MKYRVSVVLFLASAVVAQVLLPPKPDEPKPTGSVSGVVKNAANGEPLANITVRLGNYVRGNTHSTKTDAQGRYTVREVGPGRGYVDVGSYSGDEPVWGTRAIALAEGQELRSIDFSLPLKGSISGVVTDENREPVPGLDVSLLGSQYVAGKLRYFRRVTERTNDRGEYRIPGVMSDISYLILAMQGSQLENSVSEVPADPKLRRRATIPTYYPSSEFPEGASEVILRPGEERESVNIRALRSPSYCVEGVMKVEGRPSAMTVMIHQQHLSFGIAPLGGVAGIPPGVKTGPDGKFRICDLPTGNYRLTAYSGDINAPDFYGTTGVVIENRDVRDVAVLPQPRLPVKGQVVWAAGPPEKPANANTSLRLMPLHRSIEPLAVAVRVPIPGEFVLLTSAGKQDLLIDDYWVVNPGALTGSLYRKDITYGDVSVIKEGLRLGSFLNAELRIIVGHDGGFLKVKAVNKGDPAPDTKLVIFPEGVATAAELAAVYWVGTADQTGYYASPALKPGKYDIVATSTQSNAGYWTPDMLAKILAMRSSGKRVDIAPNATVELTMEPVPLP